MVCHLALSYLGLGLSLLLLLLLLQLALVVFWLVRRHGRGRCAGGQCGQLLLYQLTRHDGALSVLACGAFMLITKREGDLKGLLQPDLPAVGGWGRPTNSGRAAQNLLPAHSSCAALCESG